MLVLLDGHCKLTLDGEGALTLGPDEQMQRAFADGQFLLTYIWRLDAYENLSDALYNSSSKNINFRNQFACGLSTRSR